MKCVLDDKVDCPLDFEDLREYSKELLSAIEVIANMMSNSMTGNSDCDSCSCLKLVDAHDIAKQLLSRGYMIVPVRSKKDGQKPDS